jgi:hypothetical protein
VPLVRTDDDIVVEIGYRVAALALLALVAGTVLGWPRLIPVALVLLGGLYGAELAVEDSGVDPAASLVALGLFLTAELAYWSLEEQRGFRLGAGELLRRLAVVAGMALGVLLAAAGVVVLVDAFRTGGLAVDVLGAAAAAATLVAIAIFARRREA